MNCFEIYKRVEEDVDNEEISIFFFLNFMKFCYYEIGKDDDVINMRILCYFFEKVSVSSDYLNIIMEILGDFYCLIVRKIVEYIRGLFFKLSF